MPIYEYQCRNCLREFEELVSADASPPCPHCHAADTRKKVSSPCAFRPNSSADFPAPASSGGGCAGCSGGSCASCGH
jgi:putative FmdB family regulatory protein